MRKRGYTVAIDRSDNERGSFYRVKAEARPDWSLLRTLLAPWGYEGAEAGAGAMLVACRLAGLSALEGHYAGLNACAQFGPTQRSSGHGGQRDRRLRNPRRSPPERLSKRPGCHPPADRNLASSAVLERLSLGLLKREASTSDALAHAIARPGREAKPLSLSPRSDAQFRPIFYSSLSDGVMLGTAWIDRPVDTQDLHSLLPRPP